jgi:hypothetical protein
MVSVPLELNDVSAETVFPDAVAMYTWNAETKSYIEPDTIKPEKGYWVAVTEYTQLTITGTPVATWTAPLTVGWNMVGSVHGAPVPVDSLDDEGTGAVLRNAIYWWNPGTKSYDAVSTIDTGRGSWVATTQACSLTVTAPP